MSDIIIAYDISDDDDRAKVAARCSVVGVRIQRSVFHCQVAPDDLPAFLADLQALIDPNVDVLHLQPVCRACRAEAISIGQTGPDMDDLYWIL